MAGTEAEFPSSAVASPAGGSPPRRRAPSPRTIVRAGAVALALLGVAALVVRPGRVQARAEAQFVVPEPLEVDAVIGAIRTQGRDGTATATATANGWRITVISRSAGRARTVAIARLGLDTARQRVTTVESRRAQAARNDRAQASAQITTLASRTGLADPEPEYQAKVRVVRDLVERRERAVSAGEPVGAIDAQLAENQEAAFDLKLVVTRHTELIDERTAAAVRERDAKRAIDAVTRAVRSTSVEVSDLGGGTGFGVATGVAALVAAVLLVLLSALVARRAVSPAAAEPDASDSETPRYERFYRALAPPERDSWALDVDLVAEEAREQRTRLEPQARAQHDGPRPG